MGVLEYTDGILRHKVSSLLPVIMFTIRMLGKSVAFFLFQLVTHRYTLHGELNFYPKISVLVNIQFPENSFFRHASVKRCFYFYGKARALTTEKTQVSSFPF